MPQHMVSVPERGCVLATNVDPMTGLPAILGEASRQVLDLEAAGVPWRERSSIPLDRVAVDRPGLHARIVDLVRHDRTPSVFLIEFESDDVRLLRQEPVNLSPRQILRYFRTLFETGAIDPNAFLDAVPPPALLQRGQGLDSRLGGGLVLETQGTPICGGVTWGTLTTFADHIRSSSTRRAPSLILVDRVEAQHTSLLHDPLCAGVLAVRGSPVDHFALLAAELDFLYLVLPGHWVTSDGLGSPHGVVPFGSLLTIDCATGRVLRGKAAIQANHGDQSIAVVEQLLERSTTGWIGVRLNVDSPDDLSAGLPLGVGGVGLLRTEHMLGRAGQQGLLEQFLCATDGSTRATSLAQLGAFFRQQFQRCFQVVGSSPMTIRLLDYPLHELGTRVAVEVNPMLGMRGIRQGVAWPELYRLQIAAALDASEAVRLAGEVPNLQLLLPLVTDVAEVRLVKEWVREAIAARPRPAASVTVGVMIETPAAALTADELATECDFLSIGSNDLTQFCLGLSREDYLPVLRAYRRHHLLREDPFEHCHPTVLRLIREAARRAKRARAGIVVSLCGVHAMDVRVLELCREGLIDYVSVPRHCLGLVRLEARRLNFSASQRVETNAP